MANTAIRNTKSEEQIKAEERLRKRNNVKKWVSLFRQNPDIFVEKYLNFHLKWF